MELIAYIIAAAQLRVSGLHEDVVDVDRPRAIANEVADLAEELESQFPWLQGQASIRFRVETARALLSGRQPALINENDVREALRVADLLIAEAEKP